MNLTSCVRNVNKVCVASYLLLHVSIQGVLPYLSIILYFLIHTYLGTYGSTNHNGLAHFVIPTTSKLS